MFEFIISKSKLNEIANNFVLSNHAKERVKERLGNKTNEELSSLIIHSYLAWNNNDGCINVAINKDYYFVISKSHINGKYVIITIKEQSKNGVTADKKFSMAFFSKRRYRCRKNKK